MTKYEFLNDLKASLTGNVSGQVINENMQYYDEYIAGEVRKGKTEAETLEGLGDPRLIARTIIDTQGDSSTRSTYADESWEEEGTGGGFFDGGRAAEKARNTAKNAKEKVHKAMSEETARKIRLYVTIALVLILIVLIVGFIVTAVGAMLYIFWPVLLVLLLVHLMTRNNRYR